MSIKINDTFIKKIIVENTEVFSVYKKFGAPTNQCIGVKPFTFARDADASVFCTPGNPQEPSITNRVLSATDTMYAFEKITGSHLVSYTLDSTTSLIRHFPGKCEISFLNDSTIVGTKTYTYSNSYTPTVQIAGISGIIRRTFQESSGMSLSSSIICDSSTITLSDFDKVNFHNKRITWTAVNHSADISGSGITIFTASSEVAMFPRTINDGYFTYIIEPLIMSDFSFISVGNVLIVIHKNGNNYTISTLFSGDAHLETIGVATEE